MGWTIARKDGGTIPSGQASIDDGGKAIFGRHETDDDTVYVITYTDTTCTASTEHTVKGCGGGGDDPHPQPDPIVGVPTMDNMGKVCKESKTTPSGWEWAAIECPNHWWSGPFDDDDIQHIDDIGISWQGDDFTDSIRYPEIGEGTHGEKVTSYTTTAFSVKVGEDYKDWLSFEVRLDEHTLYDGTSPGWIVYYIKENSSSEKRIGTITVTTTGGTSCCDWVEGSGYAGQEWMTEGNVYFYQQGNGSTPTTCTLDVKGNESSSLPPIPASGATDFFKVGTYETDCEGDWGTPTLSSGVNFVTAWEFRNDGGVYAKASENIGEARSTKYNVTKGDANDDFTVDQDGTGTTECTCSNANLSITGKTIEGVSNTRALVASYTSDCDLESLDNYGHVTGDSIVNQTGPGQYQFSNGNIYMPVSENTSSEQRSEVYQFCDERFTITQLGKCAITNFQVDPTVMRDGVELGGTVAYHLNICGTECNETVEFTFHNNGRVTTIHHYPPFTSSYISDSFWVEPTVWAVGDAYFQVDVKGETKTYTFQVKP